MSRSHGSATGVNRLKDGKVTTYTTTNGLSDNVVLALAEDHEDSLWIATRKQLDRLKDGKVYHFTTGNGLPDSIVLSLYTDRHGTLWAGTRAGLCRFDGHRFVTYTTNDGLSNNYVVSIYEDQRNTLWIGTGGGGLSRLENGHFSSFTTQNGLSSDAICSLSGDPDGTLWIGTGGGGLNRFKNGKFTVYTVRNGLFDDELFQVLSDRHGYLWMSSNKGVFRVSKWQLDAYAEGRLASISSTVYGTSEGLKNKECNGGFQPAGWQTKDGRLLFPTMKGLAIVDPGRLGTNRLAPPVSIERVSIDGINFDLERSIKAKPGKGRLQFEFTALSLVSSDKVRFKYKLDDFDKDWTDAGTRRAAYYTNIPPGRYRFTVIACNSDGVWNTTGASFDLILLPHFYQTRLFIAVCIALISGLCFGIYRFRINHLKANQRRLARLVDERTQALQEQIREKERAHAELAEAQQNLIELSRRSGMAEVATGVLHNVGNVLNSVNVGASVINGKLRDSRIDHLSAAIDMLNEHAHDLSRFVESDPKGQRVLPYLTKVTRHMQTERTQVLHELETLTTHIDHIKEIIAAQQDYAKVSALIETVSVQKLVDQALRMVEASLGRHQIQVIREIEDVPELPVAKHKVVEILINLIRNAKQAIVEHNGPLRQIRICVRRHAEDHVRIEVHDSGIGLPPENLTRIFAHGFTTKRHGHGFGLHSGALAAKQMQGALWAESKGLGFGASFILELPVRVPATAPEMATT